MEQQEKLVLRRPQKSLAYFTKVAEKWPRAGKKYADVAGCDLDSCHHFDQTHTPRAGVTFSQRIGLASAIEIPPPCPASPRFWRKLLLGFRIRSWVIRRLRYFLGRRRGDVLPELYKQVVR